ncbi:DUF4105 domain-containing protein [Thermosulfurimonas marina]|uniref:DUF4105 domain-containing protein n=1 Tax=Thermosulfurimonas marina TaxID=2047767 RepID=A0A6H1WRK9_9BACT|nr:DUF4105 domain-containing protein [Thermosulfurimonas marina]QJA05823.1 DUF4105 domain-containing protein [Thermosulfurimonas marina]
MYKFSVSISLIIICIGYSLSCCAQRLPKEIIYLALHKKLYLSPTWKVLLHIDPYSKRPYIKDPSFILSYSHFSLAEEMKKTIESFFLPPGIFSDSNAHPICRFPARKLFIEHELNLSENIFPQVECKDFNYYLKKAPADNIYLVFASENIKNPASMMGHLFLKLEGINDEGRQVAHAVSFFAVINTYNPLKLGLESLFTGMRGIFSLMPYYYQVAKYLEKEERNIWEYKLNLSSYQKKLLYFHIWELKDVKMEYYFQGYNCATVIYYLLSLANPEIFNKKAHWISPLDVVKLAKQYGLINDVRLLPSDQWLIRMLEERLNFWDILLLKFSVEKGNEKYFSSLDPQNVKDFYRLKLGEVYGYYSWKHGIISKKVWKNLEKIFRKQLSNSPYGFDISKYKSPFKIPQETHFETGITYFGKEKFLKVDFLAASHTLEDDNREYFSESALEVGRFSFLVNKCSFKLENFKLYYMRSLIPFDLLTKGISSQFGIEMSPRYLDNSKYFYSFNISGGIGLTFRFFSDIFVYILGNLENGYGNKIYLTYNPQIGLIIYEVFHMKTWINYSYWGRPLNYSLISFSQSIFLSKNFRISFKINLVEGKTESYGIFLNFSF